MQWEFLFANFVKFTSALFCSDKYLYNSISSNPYFNEIMNRNLMLIFRYKSFNYMPNISNVVIISNNNLLKSA